MYNVLVLDMDGTIADFYGVKGWKHYLDDLNDVTPYRIAKPIYDMNELNSVLLELKAAGWMIVINTWLSRVKTEEFHKNIKTAKLDWLKRYNVVYDEIIMTDYGVDK